MADTASTRTGAGTLYVVGNGTETGGAGARAVEFVLDALPEIDGKPNAGFSYGTAHTVPSHGVSIARGHFDPHGWVVPHRTRNLYIAHIVHGTGRLELYDGAELRSQFSVAAGDTIVLPAQTLHRWVGGDTAFDFVGVECASPA